MELRLRHFAVLRVRLRKKCDVPRLQRAPHAHLVRGFGSLRGLLGPVRRNAAMGPTGELPTEIRGPALHICSAESAMFAWRTRRTSRASGSKSSAWTERRTRRSASNFPSTTETRRSREGSSPRSRRGTDPLGRRYSGTPSRRATWAPELLEGASRRAGRCKRGHRHPPGAHLLDLGRVGDEDSGALRRAARELQHDVAVQPPAPVGHREERNDFAASSDFAFAWARSCV